MSLNNFKIVMIDDNVVNRRILNLHLEKNGFEVYQFDDGKKGLDFILAHSPDLVLLDILLPDMDGFEVLKKIREKYAQKDLPVMMLSAKDTSKDMVRALEMGANDYVIKPFDVVITMARIQSQLSLKQAESAYKSSEARYRELFENSSDLIQEVGLDGHFLLTNSAWKKTLGYCTEEIAQLTLFDVLDDSSKIVYSDMVSLAQKAEETDSLDIVMVGRSGQKVDLEGRVSCYYEGGNLRSLRGIFRDITLKKQMLKELKTAKDEAELANQTKSQFLARMSHELRTPLNSVIGFSNILLKNKKGNVDDNETKYLQSIQRNGKHLLNLINDILDLSKIEAGKMPLDLREFDVTKMLNDLVIMSQPIIDQNKNVLKVNIEKNIGKMLADETRLKQCLFNLLANAGKFTEKGTIALNAQRQENNQSDQLRFEIQDTGIGIDFEQQKKLFEPFVQGPLPTSAKYGGTGLGLAITHHFCKLMGGEIQVKSTLGKGSVFTLLLPTPKIKK